MEEKIKEAESGRSILQKKLDAMTDIITTVNGFPRMRARHVEDLHACVTVSVCAIFGSVIFVAVACKHGTSV